MRCRISVGTRIAGSTCRTSTSVIMPNSLRAVPGLMAIRSSRARMRISAASAVMLGANRRDSSPVPQMASRFGTHIAFTAAG